uniref:Putative serine/threonine-protein kinase Cx32ic n=1 Tax=Rhizophora mucronata TaxID=61149 RepID=A0A2P2K3F8_RHIMU
MYPSPLWSHVNFPLKAPVLLSQNLIFLHYRSHQEVRLRP